MKKIIIILTLILLTSLVQAQTFYKNVTVQKSSPTLYLNGTGAKIDFYNGDVTLTQSSDILTLGGANYFKVGSDTIATRDYSRSYGGTGVVTLDDVQDEIADSLNVLRPLKVSVADTATMLTNYINKADTSSMLTNYINKADTASMLTPYINRADTVSMLTPYINRADTASMLSPYAHNNYFESRVDSIVGVLADTVSIATGINFIMLTPQASPPSPASEGMIYMDTDHHLYVYNGSNWIQIDN